MATLLNRAIALSAVAAASKAIEKRNTLPILSNVRIHGDGNSRLVFVGTDLDIEIHARVEAAIGEPVDITVNAEKLAKLLTNAPAFDGDITIAPREDEKAAVIIGKAAYALPTLESSDFQMLDNLPAPTFDFSGRDLCNYLERVKTAISTEETRYYLNGVYFHQQHHDGGRRTGFVATDGHRLHAQYFDAPEGMPEFDLESKEGQPGVIIPFKTVKLLHAFLKGKGAPAVVRVEIMEKAGKEEHDSEPSRIKFTFLTKWGHVTIISKTIDGTFPDYMRVVPQHNSLTATMDPAELSEALAGVSVIKSGDTSPNIKLGFDSSKAVGFYVSAKSSEGETAEYPVAAEFDFDLEIGFNAKYLLETIKTMDAPLEIRFEDAGSPALLTSSNMHGFVAVVMPTRI